MVACSAQEMGRSTESRLSRRLVTRTTLSPSASSMVRVSTSCASGSVAWMTTECTGPDSWVATILKICLPASP